MSTHSQRDLPIGGCPIPRATNARFTSSGSLGLKFRPFLWRRFSVVRALMSGFCKLLSEVEEEDEEEGEGFEGGSLSPV